MSLLALSFILATSPQGIAIGPQGTVGGPQGSLPGLQGSIDPRDPNLFIPYCSAAHPGDALHHLMHTNYEIYLPISQSRAPEGPHGPFAGTFQSGGGALTPIQVAGGYGVTGGGSGVIAIVDAYDDPYALTEFNTFSTEYGYPTQSGSNQTSNTNSVFQVVYASGSQPGSAITTGWNVEEDLDIQYAHAMAPNAKIVLVEAASNSGNDLYTAVQVASAIPGVREVSMSWGGGEYSTETSDDAMFSSRSIGYYAASGDGGAGVIYPSASPNVIACGGTNLSVNASNQWSSETGWSGSGGGPSLYEPRPSYQNGIALVGTKRGVPDIAADAGKPVWIYTYDSNNSSEVWTGVTGTSAATPILAGIQNSSSTIHRSSEWIWIYKDTSLFHDITSGNNGYSAGTGYDFVTGWGTPKAGSSL